jgi:hypothetical protein
MNYHVDREEIPTLKLALDGMTADELRKLTALTGEKAPSRKGDMAALVVQYLAGERLRSIWEGLDELQRAAVAEAVHSPSGQFDAGVFRAKYGRDPDWGSKGDFGYDRKPSKLCFFFYRSVMPADLKARLKASVPAPRQTTIAALDRLPPAYDRPFERWNEKERKREPGIEAVPLAVHERELAARREMLSVLRLVDAGKVAVSDKTRRASASTRLLDDVVERTIKVHDRGLARLIECADPALAALIAGDTRTRKHCMRAGERHLVVPASSETAFRRALRDSG